MKTTIIQNIKSIILALILVLGVSYVSAQSAWTSPTCGPTECNTPTPLNVGNVGQVKDGGLTLGHLPGATNGLIVENGLVGIGTTTPTKLLEIVRTTIANSQPWEASNMTLRDDRAPVVGVGGGLIFEGKYTANDYSTFGGIRGHKATSADPVNSSGSLDIFARSGGVRISGDSPADIDSFVPHMIVATGGNVGIGNSSPVNKLDVAGKIQATGGDVCTSLGGASGTCLSTVGSGGGGGTISSLNGFITRVRSESSDSDKKTYCPSTHPYLLSCMITAGNAPASIGDGSGVRNNSVTGGDMIYTETILPGGSYGARYGCWTYYVGNDHKAYRTDLVCAQ